MGRGRGGNAMKNYGRAVAVTNNGAVMPSSQFKVMREKATSISQMKNKDMRKELQQAISRMAANFEGFKERQIMLAPINGAFGVTYLGSDGSRGVYLDKSFFDRPKKEVEADYTKSNYNRRHGFKNTTRKPAQHTMTHELAHSVWTSNYQLPNQKAAGVEINKLYKTFMRDKSSTRKKNYGSYGTKDVDEFWAEVVTRAIHGDNDNYTRKAMKIAKRYKL